MIPTLRLVDRDGSMSMSAFAASGTRQARDLAPAWTREPAVLLARQIVDVRRIETEGVDACREPG